MKKYFKVQDILTLISEAELVPSALSTLMSHSEELIKE